MIGVEVLKNPQEYLLCQILGAGSGAYPASAVPENPADVLPDQNFPCPGIAPSSLSNDLLVALVYLQTPALAPMTMTINNLVSSFGTSWQLLTAAAFISMALPLVIFFSLQRYVVEGITAGAIKG